MILKNEKIYFAYLSRPNRKYDKENPTWELQIRTTDREKKKYWESVGLPVKAIVPDEGEPFFRVVLKRRMFKKDGTENTPPTVVDGSGDSVDGRTVGHGSIANIKLYQYNYNDKEGNRRVASILDSIQLVKHIVYTPKPIEEFDEIETEVVIPETPEEDDNDEKVAFIKP